MGWVFTKKQHPIEGSEERPNGACFVKYDWSMEYGTGQKREKEAGERE